MKYLVLVEPSETGWSAWSAWSPDLPGCVGTGGTEEETIANMREAIPFHLDGLREAGEPVPPPTTRSSWVEVAA